MLSDSGPTCKKSLVVDVVVVLPTCGNELRAKNGMKKVPVGWLELKKNTTTTFHRPRN